MSEPARIEIIPRRQGELLAVPAIIGVLAADPPLPDLAIRPSGRGWVLVACH